MVEVAAHGTPQNCPRDMYRVGIQARVTQVQCARSGKIAVVFCKRPCFMGRRR